MPVERQRWVRVPALPDRANLQLQRTVEVLDTAARVDVRNVAATTAVLLDYPHTLLQVTTTSGNVTVTLPPVATVPGFRVDVAKLTAANTVTVDGAGSETISGAATLAWTTQWQTYTLIATAAGWVIV